MADLLLLRLFCSLFGDKKHRLWSLSRLFHLPDPSKFVFHNDDLVPRCNSSDVVQCQQNFIWKQILAALVLAAVESVNSLLLHDLRLLLVGYLQRPGNQRKQHLHSRHELSSSNLWPIDRQAPAKLQSRDFFGAHRSFIFDFYGVVSTSRWLRQVSWFLFFFLAIYSIVFFLETEKTMCTLQQTGRVIHSGRCFSSPAWPHCRYFYILLLILLTRSEQSCTISSGCQVSKKLMSYCKKFNCFVLDHKIFIL